MIPMMSFGVFLALAANGGLKLAGIFAGCSETVVALNTDSEK
jgi:hypothetical protein